MGQAFPSIFVRLVATASAICVSCPVALAADQTQPGAGNSAAVQLARQSPRVRSAVRFLIEQAERIGDSSLRAATLDILQNPRTCVAHRRGLATTQKQDAVIQALFDQGLISPADAAAFASGVRAAIFPPILQPDSECPQLPQPLMSAPGSAFGGHHSYPGGLAIHESNNDLSDENLARQYQTVYGGAGRGGLPRVHADDDRDEHHGSGSAGDLPIDGDVILAAPIWHDWGKTIVFQWNADGSEFTEFNFGGNGALDAWGAPGDSRTGGHHILSIAESMARGLSPLMVVTQASAHSAPTLGNEFKVVNWLRAAAIVARIDPVGAGYLTTDSAGRLRLPALGRLGDIDQMAAGQTNLRVEYTLHNLSDADFTFSGPAVASASGLLKTLAPEFGYDASDVTTFNTRFRNPALSHLSGERLLVIYGGQGLDAVRQELKRLRQLGVI
ncbi:MAG: hypothetical protein M3O01_01655 [Pseudomonadota bacterium]|nr:hypothetical protein [Pseudomonadota bacterium]